MNFSKKLKGEEVVGTTEKGNVIRYTQIPSGELKYWKPSIHLSKINILIANKAELDQLEEDNKVFKAASRILIHCSFTPKVQMVDLLENSKILSVSEYSRVMKLIEIIPCPLFSYELFNKVLFDMVEKFDL